MIDQSHLTAFGDDGFVVLRGIFDPVPLAVEVTRALDDGFGSSPRNIGRAGNEFRYLPMMSERTPVSLALIDEFPELAARLLGRRVLPVRAKGTRYFGGTEWHSDSDLDIASLGFVAYLEALDADNGALRVISGSHRPESLSPTHAAVAGLSALSGQAVSTEPGDVIVFDEHLWHSSSGGHDRRQWRIDFVADPTTVVETDAVRRYFGAIFQPGWDGGYDVDRYPSYGPDWRQRSGFWNARLAELGAYDGADQEESAVRSAR